MNRLGSHSRSISRTNPKRVLHTSNPVNSVKKPDITLLRIHDPADLRTSPFFLDMILEDLKRKLLKLF